MIIYYSSKFEKEYRKLPIKIKLLAEKKEKIFRNDPYDSQLKTHRLLRKLKDFWSFSINNQYRILFEFINSNTVWFHHVGTHSVYD